MLQPVRSAWVAPAALLVLCATPAARAQTLPPPGPAPATWVGPGPTSVGPPSPAEAREPIALELGGYLGVGTRLGDSPYFQIVERAGLDFGISAYVSPAPTFSLGLLLEHTDLGRERSGVGAVGGIEVVRDLNVAWASVRVNLLRGALGTLGLAFGPGLAWQSAEASGVAAPTLGGGGFTCSGSDAANFALRGGVAGALDLGGGLLLTAAASLDNVRLSADVLDGCAPGAGTASLFGARFGFSYGFDVGPYVR